MSRIYVTYTMKGRYRGQVIQASAINRVKDLEKWARTKIATRMGCAVRWVSVQAIIPLHDIKS